MKKLLVLAVAIGTSCFVACNESTTTEENTNSASTGTAEMSTSSGGTGTAGNYVDLQTGKTVMRDDATGRYVDESGNTVDFYVDMNTRDTFSGQTSQNVNNALIHEGDNWRVDDTKIKIDGDEMKIKQGDKKIKIDGDEYKAKDGNTKVKSEDGETKVKTD